MSQSQNGGVNNGEQRSDEEEEDDVLGEDFEAAYSRAQKEFTREAITNSCCIFVFCIYVFLYFWSKRPSLNSLNTLLKRDCSEMIMTRIGQKISESK